MKKVFTIIGGVLVLIITVVVVMLIANYTGLFGDDVLNKQDVYVYTTNDGHTYTEARWNWKPVEFKKLINYTDTSSLPKVTVALHLDGDMYYDISLPNDEYIYDYGKTIWAIDGSYMVRVISGASMDTLSSVAGIGNGLALNQTTICTQDKVKGMKTIATLIGSYAVVANVYYGDEAWSILRDSLSNGSTSYVIDDISYADGYVELKELSYTGKYVGQVVFQNVDLTQHKYMFEGGVLWVSSTFDKLVDVKNTYLKRLIAASGGSIEETYSANGMFYAKSGSYYLGLIAYNANTTIVLFGDGEETKCNIITIMHYLE